ncbi:MAG: aldehyde:ferredoxin oxidoreductase [Oscillospiraceae bacterium]|nr:aldehyde:ferredoxin oxidoreductase [Oscillospiraceae bacterium]
MIYKDYIRVLYIDLTNKRVRVEHEKDLMPYLGGVGIGAKLLERHMKIDESPLHPDQPIVLAIGALESIYPVVTKVAAMFISPLTGELGESYAGGRLGLAMFQAGYDAIVITGYSKKPIYLTIHENDVLFRDANALWHTGKDNAGQIIRDYEQGHGGKRSIIRIGTAGENMVSYACVNVDRYRHFGRLGLGAVFGSKHLKAVNIVGDRSVPIENFKDYFAVYREIEKKCTEHGGAMSKYHDVGTPINIEPLSAMGGLPTRNLQAGTFEHAQAVGGETFARELLVRKMACTGCPVGCIHIGQFRREFAEHGYEYEAVSVGYDYELIYALGTFLGIGDPQEILQLIHEVEVCGHDAMSVGVVLGWATEALEKLDNVTLEETLGLELEFGKLDPYRMAVHYIAERKNDFYSALADGVRAASAKYGGEDFACHIGGNEMAGYHTGYGSLMGCAVGARHSHLCNGGYSQDQAGLSEGKTAENVDPKEMAQQIFNEEVERCMLNALVMCLFARKVYDRPTILKALNAIKHKEIDSEGNDITRYYTNDDLTDIARLNYYTKLQIKKKLNFDWKSMGKLPKRFFSTDSATGKLKESMSKEILAEYIKLIEAFESEMNGRVESEKLAEKQGL